MLCFNKLTGRHKKILLKFLFCGSISLSDLGIISTVYFTFEVFGTHITVVAMISCSQTG